MGLVAAAAVVTGVGVVTGVTSGELWIFFGFGGARLGNEAYSGRCYRSCETPAELQ
jgi:hypothetical protein